MSKFVKTAKELRFFKCLCGAVFLANTAQIVIIIASVKHIMFLDKNSSFLHKGRFK